MFPYTRAQKNIYKNYKFFSRHLTKKNFAVGTVEKSTKIIFITMKIYENKKVFLFLPLGHNKKLYEHCGKNC